MTNLRGDLAYAVRTLRKSPGFSITALLTLAICIGATVTVFSVLDRVLLRPLPYPHAERLVLLWEQSEGGDLRLASYPTFRDWREQSRAFDGLAFARGTGGMLASDTGREQLTVASVSRGFFTVLGARPLVGRTFLPEEERAGGVVVLSHALWRRRFGGDPGVVGRTIQFDGGAVTVVGVMPPGAGYPEWAELWRPIEPLAATDPALARRGVHSDSRVVGRLAPGVSQVAALADLGAVQGRLAAAYPAESATWTSARLRPLRDQVVGDSRPALLVLGAAVAFVLLIACVNVANLSFVRASTRAREIAIRAVLGASRARIARQLMAESAVLAAAAGALGLLLAAWAVHLLRVKAPLSLPRAAELVVDGRVAGFALALTAVAACVFGVAPTLRAAGVEPGEPLRGGRHTGAGRRGGRVRGLLTVAQLALAVVLLVGAGLLIKSFRRMRAVDVGFDTGHLLAVRISPPSPRYDGAERAEALYRRLLERAAAVPGVTSVAVVNHLPLSGASIATRVLVPGRVEDPRGEDAALYKTVSEGYLRTVGMRLLAGRWFTEADMTRGGVGVVVSDVVATRYWPGESPIGKALTIFRSSQGRPEFGTPMPSQVIGVVSSVRHFGPTEETPTPEVFVPYTRETWPWASLVVRTAGDPARVAPALRRAVLDVDPELPVEGGGRLYGVQPLDGYLSSFLEPQRYATSLLGAFALAALLLAAIGVYGVTAYAVSQRTRELGVRMALGATAANVVRHVLRDGALHAAAGVALGLGGAAAATRLLTKLLFGTSPLDAATFVLVPLLLVAVAAAACLAPALRAARIAPTEAMRAE
jgi:putative ABC transport system permease protein